MTKKKAAAAALQSHFPPHIPVVARNATAHPLQLIWMNEVGGLLPAGEEVRFEFPLDQWPIMLELTTPVSPDSTTLTPGEEGQLYAADGVWTFGADLGDGTAAVRLNGLQPNAYKWSGSQMRVDRGGLLHLLNGEEWWVWTPRRFTRTEAP